MVEFPELEGDDGERYSFENIWRDISPQEILGADCFNPDIAINNANNRIVLDLTGQEFREIYSALYAGAELTYPEKFMQVIVNFLKGVHCPPLMTEQECFEYPSYAPFLQYLPVNPYLEPDEIPEGYLAPPFLVNGENGNDIPNFEHWDIYVQPSTLPLDAGWFDELSEHLPTIKIMVEGEGKVFVKLLTQVAGGLAVITVDDSPNLVDILAGIVTSADNILDLNLDVVSLPPETALEVIYEADIVGAGMHTIYVTFLPVLDDSLIPLRFGGGFRSVQLCNFVEQPEMGLSDIRFNGATCNLEVLNAGEWEVVTGWEDWLDCIPSGGGGGSGGGALTVHANHINLGSNQSNSTQTFATVASLSFTPTRENMLVIVNNMTLRNSSANGNEVRLLFNSIAGNDANLVGSTNTADRETDISDWWSGLTVGVAHNIDIQLRCLTAGNTATIITNTKMNVTIIEFDDLSDLFVEDIRIIDEELQKKIGGVWITVSDSLKTLLDAVQAAAAAAQASANSAIATNTAQQTQINAIITVNNAQNARLDDIEDVNDAQNVILTDHEARITALEEAATPAGVGWSHEFDFTTGEQGWDGHDYVGGSGFIVGPTAPYTPEINYTFDLDQGDSRIQWIEATLRKQAGTGFQAGHAEFPIGENSNPIELPGTIGNAITNWIQVNPTAAAYEASMKFDFAGGGHRYYVERLKFWGRGTDPF